MMADGVFDRDKMRTHEDHGCSPTGRYKGGYDSGGGAETSVVLEERTCGAWLLVQIQSELRP